MRHEICSLLISRSCHVLLYAISLLLRRSYGVSFAKFELCLLATQNTMRFQLIFGLLGLAAASPLLDHKLPSRNTYSSLSSRSIATSRHVSTLTRKTGSKRAAAAVSRLEYGQAPLISAALASDFLTQISFGSQTFEVIIDTGSSDTWLATTGFTCVNQTDNATLTEADCYFGPLFQIDSSFTQIPDENFNITYADGEYLNGVVGFDSVTVAGIVVPKQEVGVVYLAAWDGDGISSGLMGLAFPTLTSAYPGTNVSADENNNVTDNAATYPSIIDTIFEIDNLTQQMFSIALSRDEANTSYGGVIAIGGIPDLTDPTINASSTFVTTPIVVLATQFIDPSQPQIQFYTIDITSISYGPADSSSLSTVLQGAQFIVDSGTTLVYIPTPEALAFNALFDPPAYGYNETGLFFVDCNATAPSFAVTIAGETFEFNPFDLVMYAGDGECISGVQDAGDLPDTTYILGDTFLRNVLAVFDWGNLEMQ